MRYQVLRGFCRGGGVNVEPGEIFESDPKEVREYLHLGYITPAAEESAPSVAGDEAGHPEQDPETLAKQDDKPTTREPKHAESKRR